ncbi:peroxiredoxin [Mesomycoplasma conjunctivae]|uniref:peroxiredoxin n=1 Tax=Mesomycoplasma conjunctivae TaxID=45361 RepID=UPI003DA43015
MTTKFANKEYKLTTPLIQKGQILNFEVTNTKFETIKLNKFSKKTVISVFPSINTSVCDEQTIMINTIAKKYPNVDFISISLDLPTAIAQWLNINHSENITMYSDYKYRDFGQKTGFLIDEIFLLNRGFIIVDHDGKVIAVEANTNVHDQIDFEKLEQYLQ